MKTAQWIKDGRDRRGWSQRALAKALGVSPGAVGQWETGDNRPSLANLLEMASLFETSVEQLLGPDSDYPGELIEDPNELLVIHAWRRIGEQHRATLVNMMRGLVEPPALAEAPKPRRSSRSKGAA